MNKELMDRVEVVYEDDDLLVINKPAGLVVTSEGVSKENTLEDWIAVNYAENKNLLRKGIVHRLDKGTSGLMVIAKNEKTEKSLKPKFKNREVKKKYWALIGGDVVKEGEIKAPIKRSGYVFGRWKVDPDGKEARTIFRKIGDYMRDGKKYSLLEIDLKTGRTHQIRVHMNYLRWPLVGDKLYGGETKSLCRPFLQAKYLGFHHPTSGEWCEFECQPADDLIEELKLYEKI